MDLKLISFLSSIVSIAFLTLCLKLSSEIDLTISLDSDLLWGDTDLNGDLERKV